MTAKSVSDYVGLSHQPLEGEGESRHGFDPTNLAIVEGWFVGTLRQLSFEGLVVRTKFKRLAIKEPIPNPRYCSDGGQPLEVSGGVASLGVAEITTPVFYRSPALLVRLFQHSAQFHLRCIYSDPGGKFPLPPGQYGSVCEEVLEMLGSLLILGRPDYLGLRGGEGKERVSDRGEVQDEGTISHDKAEESLDLSGRGEREGPFLHGGDFVKHDFDASLCNAMPEKFHLFLYEFAFG